jgi:nucleoside-diphosphate-sugar epimerase
VNCVGLQRGTEDELIAANITWPRWLANDVLAGTGARLVHLGSAAEYGDPGSATPLRETDLARPRGLYGETKWAGSAAVVDAARSGLDAVVARGFNFVGSRLPSTSPLHQFVADVSALGPEGGRVDVWWPDTVRDFILLTDLARAVMALAGAPAVPDLVNVCSGTGISFAEAVMAIAARQRKPVEIISLERPGIPTVIGDNRLMVSTCGFTPVMSAGILAANAGVGEVMV